jgi:drug/metabolite transporter (DMT)-like permease
VSPTVFTLVLLSALLHATWNALIKGATDKALMTVAVTVCAGLVGVLSLPFFPPPAPASWIFIAASGCASAAYFLMVGATYKVADMSLAYPVMRGSAPLIVGIAGVLLFEERLPLLTWIGISVISAGILSMALAKHEHGPRGVMLAGVTALLVAVCTLIDAEGARRSQSPAAYTLSIFALTGLLLSIWAIFTKGREFPSFLRHNWALSLVAGVGALCSYGTALWAMTIAPVAVVTVLRETTVLFGAFIAWLFLKESVDRSRLIAIVIIASGAVLLRVS